MTKIQRKALAQKYRDAARLIEEGYTEYGCFALKDEGLDCVLFTAWFKEDAMAYGMAHDGYALEFSWMANALTEGEGGALAEVRDYRVIALCLLASMIEAGDAI